MCRGAGVPVCVCVVYQVQLAGLQQLEAANGVGATPLVTLRVKPEEDGSASTDALQVNPLSSEWPARPFLGEGGLRTPFLSESLGRSL